MPSQSCFRAFRAKTLILPVARKLCNICFNKVNLTNTLIKSKKSFKIPQTLRLSLKKTNSVKQLVGNQLGLCKSRWNSTSLFLKTQNSQQSFTSQFNIPVAHVYFGKIVYVSFPFCVIATNKPVNSSSLPHFKVSFFLSYLTIGVRHSCTHRVIYVIITPTLKAVG